jgi:diadenosine tetraphosphate (Ap4A) HIT family hydrolase
VEHCVGPLGVGTLVVKPKRHVVHVANLDDREAAELGPLLRRTSTVVAELTAPYGPEMQFAMFHAKKKPQRGEVDAFADDARALFA